MISFDTLFSVIIAIIISYLSAIVGIAMEKNKNKDFKANRFVISMSILYFLLISLSYYVYHNGFVPDVVIMLKTYTQPIWDFIQSISHFILNSRLFPFYKSIFRQDYFVLIYILGLIPFMIPYILFLQEMVIPDLPRSVVWIIVILLLFSVLFLFSIHVEVWISTFVYSIFVRFGFWVALIGNIFLNFALGFAPFYVISSIF